MALTKLEKETIKTFGGLASIVLAHGACIITGGLKGSLNAKGMDFDSHFPDLWAANALGSSYGLYSLEDMGHLNDEYDKGEKLANLTRGAVFGTLGASIQYTLGYSLGYAGSWLADRIF
ncbi:MAG: hypothetical protein ACQESG_06630 [Nanobdellota archaeon]